MSMGQENSFNPEVQDATFAVAEFVVFFTIIVFLIVRAVSKRKSSTRKYPNSASYETKAKLDWALAAALRRGDGKFIVGFPVDTLESLTSDHPSIIEVHITMASSEMDLSSLKHFPNASSITLSGPPLRLDHLVTFRSLSSLQELHLSDSRAVVDANNSIEGFCKAKVFC